MTINLESLVIRKCRMKLKNPFTTSFGTIQERDFLVIELIDKDGRSGWGESVAFLAPWYTEETLETTYHMLKDFLIPLIQTTPIDHPDELQVIWKVIKGNPMAKASLEGAFWDLYARQNNDSLARTLGGEKKSIDVGISIGIQQSTHDLFHIVGKAIHEGYKRIKLKIKPGHDIQMIKAVRERFPDLPLMVDANSAYTLKDIDLLKALDDFNLLMIEQPLSAGDLVDHAEMQRHINTPICLDESIASLKDAEDAIQLKSCKIINVKIGRVGGLTVSKQIHDLCFRENIPVWCGGMLEAGIGRAHNIALTSLPQFILPGDTSGSDRYWERDIVRPEIKMRNGQLIVPDKMGMGYEIDWEALEFFTTEKETYKFN